jgi:hypothetical protein
MLFMLFILLRHPVIKKERGEDKERRKAQYCLDAVFVAKLVCEMR